MKADKKISQKEGESVRTVSAGQGSGLNPVPPAKVVWRALGRAARARPDKGGYVFKGQTITFKDMDRASDNVACGLLNLGVTRGDRIGVIEADQPEWFYAWFAAAKIGAAVVGLGARHHDAELDYMINQSECRTVVSVPSLGGRDYVKHFKRHREQFPSVTAFIFIGAIGFRGSLSLEALLNTRIDQAALDRAKALVRPNDILMIVYTPGQANRPRGAMLSHQNRLAAARAEVEHIRLTADDKVFAAWPRDHVFGITGGIVAGLLAGSATWPAPAADPDVMVRICKEYEPTILANAPAGHARMLGSGEFGSWRSRRKVRLVINQGANPDPDLLVRLMEAFPRAVIMNRYGRCEASGGAIMSPWDSDFDHTVRCIGKTIGGVAARVADADTGAELPYGETGELCLKGDCVIPGYFRLPEETEAVFRDGWFHTGDRASMDRDGYLTLGGTLS